MLAWGKPVKGRAENYYFRVTNGDIPSSFWLLVIIYAISSLFHTKASLPIFLIGAPWRKIAVVFFYKEECASNRQQKNVCNANVFQSPSGYKTLCRHINAYYKAFIEGKPWQRKRGPQNIFPALYCLKGSQPACTWIRCIILGLWSFYFCESTFIRRHSCHLSTFVNILMHNVRLFTNKVEEKIRSQLPHLLQSFLIDRLLEIHTASISLQFSGTRAMRLR